MNSLLDSSQLVFIVSQPRSGSTLLQAILSNHPKVDTTSEHWILLRFASLLKPGLLRADFDMHTCADAFEDFLGKYDAVKEFENDTKRLLLKYYEKVQKNTGNLVIDKTPRYYEILPELLKLFPKAKIILLVRNPLASWASMMKTWQRYDLYNLCKHHRRDILQAPLLIQEFYQNHTDDKRVKKITFEELLASSEKIVKELCDWLEIKYSAEMLNYGNNVKFRGKYGDPIGVNKYTSLQSHKLDQLKCDKHPAVSYKELLNGYAHFLGKSFLNEYGNYKVREAKKSLKFTYFKFYCDHFNLFERYNFTSLLRVLLRYSSLKIFTKLFN
ncbi:sulfotransferase [Catalinimonas sp. 4WD22]|uniref:sulfotransferase family protein n=1 Tax=Catalinimonas locisalis TaxID=3133978 RepID=UPI0031010B60